MIATTIEDVCMHLSKMELPSDVKITDKRMVAFSDPNIRLNLVTSRGEPTLYINGSGNKCIYVQAQLCQRVKARFSEGEVWESCHLRGSTFYSGMSDHQTLASIMARIHEVADQIKTKALTTGDLEYDYGGCSNPF